MAQKPKIVSFPSDREHAPAALRVPQTAAAGCGKAAAHFWMADRSGSCPVLRSQFFRVSPDSLKQFGAYLTAGLSNADAGNIVEYATENTPVVAAFEDGVAVADSDTLNLQKPGTVQFTELLGYSAPVLETTERYVLVYDRGGFR